MAEHDHYGLAATSMAGGEHKPPKVIHHIRTRKAKGGSFIHEHHHTAPEHHPVEEHTSPDQDGMVEHMLTHLGEPNPGETESDMGQSGIPSGNQPNPPTVPPQPPVNA